MHHVDTTVYKISPLIWPLVISRILWISLAQLTPYSSKRKRGIVGILTPTRDSYYEFSFVVLKIPHSVFALLRNLKRRRIRELALAKSKGRFCWWLVRNPAAFRKDQYREQVQEELHCGGEPWVCCLWGLILARSEARLCYSDSLQASFSCFLTLAQTERGGNRLTGPSTISNVFKGVHTHSRSPGSFSRICSARTPI